jgi:hypothetical protein
VGRRDSREPDTVGRTGGTIDAAAPDTVGRTDTDGLGTMESMDPDTPDVVVNSGTLYVLPDTPDMSSYLFSLDIIL